MRLAAVEGTLHAPKHSPTVAKPLPCECLHLETNTPSHPHPYLRWSRAPGLCRTCIIRRTYPRATSAVSRPGSAPKTNHDWSASIKLTGQPYLTLPRLVCIPTTDGMASTAVAQALKAGSPVHHLVVELAAVHSHSFAEQQWIPPSLDFLLRPG